MFGPSADVFLHAMLSGDFDVVQRQGRDQKAVRLQGPEPPSQNGQVHILGNAQTTSETLKIVVGPPISDEASSVTSLSPAVAAGCCR